MSRLCAKPTCSAAAMRWLNLNAAQQRVIEQHGPSESTIGLCAAHAERFSMPNGWKWVGLAASTESQATNERSPSDSPGKQPDSAPATRRRHGRDSPWFLANADSAAPSKPSVTAIGRDAATTSASATPTAIEQPNSATVEHAAVPSTGSLLHRAFHGPGADGARAHRDSQSNSGIENRESEANAQREPRTVGQSADGFDRGNDDEVAPVRDTASPQARHSSSSTHDVELPFPPADVEPHVAVS